ncbi:Uncharacterised protein [Mycobacterium tuberculosis]|nr:Uncharacterised protein [Mycobacterium tuberculosis]
MQVVVAERSRAENPRIGEQERVLVGEGRKLRPRVDIAQGRQRRLGSFVVALCRGQTDFQELGPP